MLDHPAIARLEEGHCAMTLREVGRESIDIGGGVACRDVPGTWINRAEGMGLAGPVSEDDIARMIKWFESAGIEPKTKICPYVDPTLPARLCAAGFVVQGFEQLLVREIGAGERFESPTALGPGIEIRLVDPTDAARCREIAVVKNRGFGAPGAPLREPEVELSIRCIGRERAATFGAYHGGVCVGGGGVERLGGLGGLYGAAVDQNFRGRGIQQALMAARLNECAARGLRFATIGSAPGHITERNALRFGFRVAYTKTVMVKRRPVAPE